MTTDYPTGYKVDIGREGAGPAEAATCIAQVELHNLASSIPREVLKLSLDNRLGNRVFRQRLSIGRFRCPVRALAVIRYDPPS